MADRQKRSKRDFIDADGNTVKRMEEAVGARYTVLDHGEEVDSFEHIFGGPGNPTTMFAIMGFHTKVGNVLNSVLNDKDNPGTPEQAAKAVNEWLTGVDQGTWAERAEGVGGTSRIDRDILAQCVAQVAQQAGQDADVDAIRQRMDDEKGYVAKCRKVPQVRELYDQQVGAKQQDVSSLL